MYRAKIIARAYIGLGGFGRVERALVVRLLPFVAFSVSFLLA